MVIRLNENDIRRMVEASVKRILNEGTDTLYHFTTEDGLIGIIKNNLFKLTDNRKYTEGGNVMSFSRTKCGPYMEILRGSRWLVRLTIDGRKLNQRYKTYPINDLYVYPQELLHDFKTVFTPKEIRKNFRFGQDHWWDAKITPSFKDDEFEYEDRLVSKLKAIPNAMSYVTRIDIYEDDFWATEERRIKNLADRLLGEYGDLVHVYKDAHSFYLQKKSGEIPPETLYAEYADRKLAEINRAGNIFQG